MAHAQLNATLRPVGGKGNARSTRRENKIPAVIYGNKESPILIALERFKLTPLVMKAGFLTHVLELDIDGKTHLVLPRDVQLDAVSDQPLHVDFLRVTDKTEIRIEVPVTLEGADKAPGVKKGGVVNIVSHTLGVYALAGAIPEAITIDVSALDIADSLHMSQVQLPKGVRLINPAEASMTIVTIAAPIAAEAEATVTAAPAAPAKKGAKAAPAPAAAAAPAKAPAKKK